MKAIRLFLGLIIIIMMIVTINTRCSIIGGSQKDPTMGELVLEVNYFDDSWDSCSWGIDGTQYTQEINPEIVFDDLVLQKSVQKYITAIPLNTDEAITVYAWDILSILIECGYLPEGWVPILASHFSNDIWIISYADGRIDRSGVRDGTIDVYVAAYDGHIVFIYDI